MSHSVLRFLLDGHMGTIKEERVSQLPYHNRITETKGVQGHYYQYLYVDCMFIWNSYFLKQMFLYVSR